MTQTKIIRKAAIDMYYEDTISLVAESTTQDADGYEQTTETRTEIYANVKSATRSEFYSALQSGITAAAVFEVFKHDYDGQRLIDYDGQRYKVERAYSTSLDKMELTCSEVKR